jgi:hypothetical protein
MYVNNVYPSASLWIQRDLPLTIPVDPSPIKGIPSMRKSKCTLLSAVHGAVWVHELLELLQCTA